MKRKPILFALIAAVVVGLVIAICCIPSGNKAAAGKKSAYAGKDKKDEWRWALSLNDADFCAYDSARTVVYMLNKKNAAKLVLVKPGETAGDMMKRLRSQWGDDGEKHYKKCYEAFEKRIKNHRDDMAKDLAFWEGRPKRVKHIEANAPAVINEKLSATTLTCKKVGNLEITSVTEDRDEWFRGVAWLYDSGTGKELKRDIDVRHFSDGKLYVELLK